MKKLFQISPEQQVPSRNRTILLEYGESFCCWAVWNRDNGSILKLDYYTFENNASGNICSVIEMIRNESDRINAITTCSYYPQAVLIPAIGSYVNESIASTVYRDKFSVSLTDGIREKKIVNNFLVPVAVHSAITRHFPHSPFYHAYSPPLKHPSTTLLNNIAVHFTSKSCRVIVTKRGELQLAQIYAYSATPDIVYILLKLFEELGMPREETVVYLSGLIDKDSALYQDLHAYFLNLEFAVPLKKVLEDTTYPEHYFTSLANLAACVS